MRLSLPISSDKGDKKKKGKSLSLEIGISSDKGDFPAGITA